MIKEKYRERFEFLDGLRGIAALSVIFFHFNGVLKENGVFLPNFINFICEYGQYGVQIFFVLSGFVIAYSLRHVKISSFYSVYFILKRSIRLDPPYWIIIIIMLTQKFLGNYISDKKDTAITSLPHIFANLFYLPDILQIHRLVPVAWTLCLEIQFYLIFILLMQFNQFLKSKSASEKSNVSYLSIFSYIIFGSLMLVSILQKTSWAILPDVPGIFINYWYSFFIGSLTCWTILKFLPSVWFWINMTILGCYILFQGNVDAFATLITTLMIYAVALSGNMHYFLSSWFFQYTGKISYSLYLIHWPIGVKMIDLSLRFFSNKFAHMGSVFLLLMLSLVTTFLAAHVFYYLIEYPSLLVSRKLRLDISNQKQETELIIAK